MMQSEHSAKQGFAVNAPAVCSTMLAASLGLSMPNDASVVVESLAREADDCIRQCEVDGRMCVSLSGKALIQESLESLARRYCSGNQNGYGEEPVSTASLNFAMAFVRELPMWVLPAEAYVDADGEVSIEWYESKERFLELSFADSGFVRCFAGMDEGKWSGLLNSPFDENVFNFIKKISNV